MNQKRQRAISRQKPSSYDTKDHNGIFRIYFIAATVTLEAERAFATSSTDMP
jgi:hypothetical protein